MTQRGLFLDFDGTLADSIKAMRDVYERFLVGFDIQPTAEEFQELNGPPLEQIVKTLKKKHSLPGDFRMLQDHYLAMVEDARLSSPPATGALDLVMRARHNGWTVAVVTSSNREGVWKWLEDNGFSDFITRVVGGNDVKRGKPDPEPYLVALSSTDCDVNRSLAVEDSPVGAASAQSAGLTTFVIAEPGNQFIWPTGVKFTNSLSGLTRALLKC